MFNVGSPYHMFMMEQESMLDTHESKVNKAIELFKKAIAEGYNINLLSIQKEIFDEAGIEYNDLSDRDIKRIKATVEKRY